MLILVSIVTDFVSISTFASLACVPVRIASSAAGINIGRVTAGIKKDKSIIKKKKHDKMLWLGKDILNTIEVLISKALINSYYSHDFFSVNSVLRQ